MKTYDVTKKEIQKWVKALRSGKYEQSKNQLQDENGYCCLGVACKIFIPKEDLRTFSDGDMTGTLPTSQIHAPMWLRVINDDVKDILDVPLSVLNDNHNLTFDEIADVLELIYIHEALNDSLANMKQDNKIDKLSLDALNEEKKTSKSRYLNPLNPKYDEVCYGSGFHDGFMLGYLRCKAAMEALVIAWLEYKKSKTK